VIRVEQLTMAYGDFVVMRDLNFEIRSGEIFIIMGGSGCGKSTLLKHLIGLLQPASGTVLVHGSPAVGDDRTFRHRLLHDIGVTYQSGALFSSMTLIENVALPLERATSLSKSEIREIASFKLSLVGLNGFEEFYPAELSGGMRKRAALARAIAIDPSLLFFDEPSAGLDPVSSARLDDLILQIRDALGTTIVVVTHELDSIFTIGDTCIFLDVEEKTLTGKGSPRELVASPPNPRILEFLTRQGKTRPAAPRSTD
jgi:phospholipid/cholesterol/gamma-HCH transport system ATP-binding protein